MSCQSQFLRKLSEFSSADWFRAMAGQWEYRPWNEAISNACATRALAFSFDNFTTENKPIPLIIFRVKVAVPADHEKSVLVDLLITKLFRLLFITQ